MGKILNEIFANFEGFENEIKEANKQSVIDKSQFDLLNPEYDLNYKPASLLSNSIILTAEEKDVLTEKQLPFGLDRKDLVEIAHPETVQVADGPHTSGVVENQNQQHRKIVEMVNKMPTGNIFHDMKLASLTSAVAELTSIANDLDKKGLYSEADLLTEAILDLTDFKKKSLNKFAAGPLMFAGVAAGIAALPILTIVSILNGYTEDLDTDLADLETHVDEWIDFKNPISGKSLYEDYPELNEEYKSIKNSIEKIRVFKEPLNPNNLPANSSQLIDNIDFEVQNITKRAKRIYDTAPGGFLKLLPKVMSYGIHPLVESASNLKETWGAFKKSTQDAASWAQKVKEKEQADVVERTKTLPSTTNQTVKPNIEPEPQPSKPQDSERIKGIQIFLNRMPYEVIGLNDELEVNGIFDENTTLALDNFAEHIANDLGLSNLTGVRLQREADNEKLRQIWDVYKNPWRYND